MTKMSEPGDGSFGPTTPRDRAVKTRPKEPSPPPTKKPSPQEIIRTDDVVVTLDHVPILHQVSMHVNAGEVVALMGANGSGKTTLVRAILGLTPHEQGQVCLFGQEIGRFHDWARVGYVPQRASVQQPQARVDEVVATGRLAHRRPFVPASAADRAIAADSLAQVGLSNRARDAFRHLSGGQQQRVLIARALAAQADLLVMDEPMAGVDLDAQDAIAALLANLKVRGLTQLIVLHETGPLAALVDRTVILSDGRVLPPDAPHVNPPGHEVAWPSPEPLVRGSMDARP